MRWSRHAVKTFSASNVDSARMPRLPLTSRPVQWPRTLTREFVTALTIRRVIAGASIASFECTLATTTSSRSSNSGSWSRVPSSRMSTSMPVRIRNGATFSRSSSMMSSWRRSRSADKPLAIFSRGEWSVSAQYSWPNAAAVLIISSMGAEPSDQSEWQCRSPRSASRMWPPPRSAALLRNSARASGIWPAKA